MNISKFDYEDIPDLWLNSFDSEKHVKKLLSINILQRRVNYNTQINGTTIGWHLGSGVLFPTQVDAKGNFLLDFPPVMLHAVAAKFGMPHVNQLDPFMRIDEDGFEEYIAYAIVTFCEAFAVDPTTVTVGEFYAGGLATAKTLAQKIRIVPGTWYRQATHPIAGDKVILMNSCCLNLLCLCSSS